MLFDISRIDIDELYDDLFLEKQVTVSVLRLDKIHPLVSGNKLFKLHYFLEGAVKSHHKTILTFGGAYSNHLAATAFACKALKLKSIGIVRGEKPQILSHTLLQCIADGMLLKFISRAEYDTKDSPAFLTNLKNELGNYIFVPEGGYDPMGAQGAALIVETIKDKAYTHICTALGTATTVAGLLMASKPQQTIIAFPVLKGMVDIEERVIHLTGKKAFYENMQIINGYDFGGYAKKTPALISFMNQFWQKYGLALDFVYTAKMLYGIIESIKHDKFTKGSNIICLHTGGLQGNKSLPLNALLF
jgi:1-aminocyclopropane-1-carboxylate deaminase/D-cysteine desulfhydrase-like pyridoxal-dependent ACC family enzyme